MDLKMLAKETDKGITDKQAAYESILQFLNW